MLLIQSLNALDCQEFSSPRRDSGFITQPWLPQNVPSTRICHDGSCHPDLILVPKGWPWIKAPCRRWMVAPAPAVPELELRGDLRAGIPDFP